MARITGGVFRVNSRLERDGGVVEVNANCFNAFPAADILDHEGVIRFDDEWYRTADDYFAKAQIGGELLTTLYEELYGFEVIKK